MGIDWMNIPTMGNQQNAYTPGAGPLQQTSRPWMDPKQDNDSQYRLPIPGMGNHSAGDIKEAGKQSFWSQMSSTGRQIDPDNMSFMDWGMGGMDTQGNKYNSGFSSLFDIGKTGLGVWLGLKQLGLAEDSLDFQKDAFSKQFTNQAKLTNAQLRDRQIRRNRENSWSTPTDEYMKQNAVSLG
jgi:hypothetical protein